MNLAEAWLNLLKLEGCKNLNNTQLYSILADYGVFKDVPKLRLIIKIALENGLWDLVVSKPSELQILDLKLKLQNEGFADNVIFDVINSFYDLKEAKPEAISNPIPENSCNNQLNCSTIKQFFGKDIIRFHSNNNGLNNLIHFIPELNSDCKITIHNLNCSLKTNEEIRALSPSSLFLSLYNKNKKVICLEYDITNSYDKTQVTKYGHVSFTALVISKEGRIHSKTYITSIKTDEKYALAKGACEIKSSLSVDQIAAIIVIPETGDIDINSDYSHRPDNDFKKFCGVIEIEPFTKKYNDIDIKISKVQVWGNKNKCSICFEVKGKTSINKGWKIGKQLTIALFNDNARLLETTNLFIGKSGYVGSRGGLHDTWMNEGIVNLLYFKYIDLKIDIADVSKIVISDQ